MTYEDPRDAKRAIQEFDGANANGKSRVHVTNDVSNTC